MMFETMRDFSPAAARYDQLCEDYDNLCSLREDLVSIQSRIEDISSCGTSDLENARGRIDEELQKMQEAMRRLEEDEPCCL